jgi:hypothetical protein
VKLLPEHVRLLESGGEDHAVSAGAALDFVTASRNSGGFLPLVATALVLLVEIVLVIAGLAEPLLLAAAALAFVPLRWLIRRGLRTAHEQRALEDAAAMRGQLGAALVDRTLLLGPAEAGPAHWLAIPVTDDEAREIQTLALPTARVRK